MKNKYKEFGGEFKNEDDIKEEIDEEEADYDVSEEDYYDLEIERKENLPKEERELPDRHEKDEIRSGDLERDEDLFNDLVNKGLSEAEAAHIVNRVAEKRRKNE